MNYPTILFVLCIATVTGLETWNQMPWWQVAISCAAMIGLWTIGMYEGWRKEQSW